MPPRPASLEFELLESSDDALGGLALRRQYAVKSADKGGKHSFGVLLYIPKGAKGAGSGDSVPEFLRQPHGDGRKRNNYADVLDAQFQLSESQNNRPQGA